jgi:prepilin-type processing-associated H-X9-DG protein
MSFEKITDGTSKTIVVGEKWVPPPFYEGGDPAGSGIGTLPGDDRGWADGWDCNNMRSALFQPRPDSAGVIPLNANERGGRCDEQWDFPFGSAHSGGINVMYADGSVGFVSYDIDQENFNRMAHRHDGETITYGQGQ